MNEKLSDHDGSFCVVKDGERFIIWLTQLKEIFAVDRVNRNGGITSVGRVLWKGLIEYANGL